MNDHLRMGLNGKGSMQGSGQDTGKQSVEEKQVYWIGFILTVGPTVQRLHPPPPNFNDILSTAPIGTEEVGIYRFSQSKSQSFEEMFILHDIQRNSVATLSNKQIETRV